MKNGARDPDQTTISILTRIEVELVKLHELLLQLEHYTMTIESPLQTGPWADTVMSPKTHEKMGAIGILLSLYCAQRWDGFLRLVLGKAHDIAPLRTETMLDAMANGMADAALACPCGACPYCLEKAKSGAVLARPEIVKQMKGNLINTFQQAALAAGASQGQEPRKIEIGRA